MKFIEFKLNDSIATITFNNPTQLNAMIPEMGDELKKLIPQINSNPQIRVVIFTGAGEAFSSGGNLDFIISHTKQDFETNRKAMMEFYAKFLNLKQIEVPTIAMINGAAVGAGLCIAMACDLRLAATTAKMGLNFAKIGLSSGMGCLYHLTHLVGPATAAELLFTGKIISAETALQIGLLNQIYPADQLTTQTLELAEQICKNSPLALKIIKKGIQIAPIATLEELFAYESAGQAKCFASEDLKEGIAAIKAKRAPKFSGK